MKPTLQLVALLFLSAFAWQAAAGQQPVYLLAPSYQYLAMGAFQNGLLKVALDEHHSGYIDTNGELTIRLQTPFDNLGNFHDDRAYIGKKTDQGMRYGFIDKHGQVVIPCIYQDVEDFSDGRAFVNRDGEWSVIDRQGKVVIGPRNWHFTYLLASSNPHSGPSGVPSPFFSGLALVEKDGLYGFIDTEGQRVIDYQYEQALHFKEGYTLVAYNPEHPRPAGEGNPHKVGSAEWLEYQVAHQTPYDPAASNHSRFWRIIDTTGKQLYQFTPDQKPDAAHFHDGQQVIFELASDDPYDLHPPRGAMDRHGDIIIPARQRQPEFGPFSDGVSILPVRGERPDNRDGYFWIIDAQAGKRHQVPFCRDTRCMVKTTQEFHGGLLGVRATLDRQGRKAAWGYIDKQGNWVIEPQFEGVASFYGGFAVVRTFDGEVGVIKNPL